MATRPKPGARKRSRQYLVDEKGKPTGVVLTLEEYDDLIEAAEQRDDIRHLEAGKRVKGKSITLEKLEAQLRAEGKLR